MRLNGIGVALNIRAFLGTVGNNLAKPSPSTAHAVLILTISRSGAYSPPPPRSKSERGNTGVSDNSLFSSSTGKRTIGEDFTSRR